jgi:ATP-dependent helicase/nuclease subunit B
MSNLLEALADGAIVVTPNNRLARDTVARFDAARREAGARTWTAATALPFTRWLDRLWRTALAARAQRAPPMLLDTSATRALWHGIVARHGRDWLNAHGAARHAADAWTLFHRFRDAGESLAPIAARALHDDPMVFGQWAERYESRLTSLRAIDEAQLPDLLADIADTGWVAGRAPVILYGFMSLTPQQQRLVAALRDAGMGIDTWAAAGHAAAHCQRVSLCTPRDELMRAFAFARACLLRDRQARIAVVVADLEERRSEVLSIAEETLCAEQLLALAPDTARPYGISLGEPLANVPLVTAALDLLALAAGTIDATSAASLVRAPFLPDAPARWTLRAECEQRWLELGLREVGWQDVH